MTWVLEVAPILIGAPILMATYRRFPLTPLLYRLLFLHALILMLGGHYTYARAPLGFWVRDLLGLARNHYDRLGHFSQGFVPAILARTQWDMFLALIGALTAQLTLGRIHDRQLAGLKPIPTAS